MVPRPGECCGERFTQMALIVYAHAVGRVRYSCPLTNLCVAVLVGCSGRGLQSKSLEEPVGELEGGIIPAGGDV